MKEKLLSPTVQILITFIGVCGAITTILINMPYVLQVVLFILLFGAAMFSLGSSIQSLGKKAVGPEIISPRSRKSVTEFIEEKVQEYLDNGESISIDGMGIQLSTLARFIESKTSEIEDWKGLDLRFLVLSDNSTGSKNREVLEGREPKELDKLASVTDINLKRINSVFINKNDKFVCRYRKYITDPSYYIIRINEAMLVGFFLAKKGVFGPYCVITEKEFPSVFNDFRHYFDFVFTSDSLSKNI